MKGLIASIREWWYWNRPVRYRRLQQAVVAAVRTTEAEWRQKVRNAEERAEESRRRAERQRFEKGASV